MSHPPCNLWYALTPGEHAVVVRHTALQSASVKKALISLCSSQESVCQQGEGGAGVEEVRFCCWARVDTMLAVAAAMAGAGERLPVEVGACLCVCARWRWWWWV